jgi:phosphinothricin acetyltransferase
MESLLVRLKVSGFKQVVAVCVAKEHNPGTHKLHAKFGFKEAGLLSNVGFKNSMWLDVAYLQLDLDSFEAGTVVKA